MHAITQDGDECFESVIRSPLYEEYSYAWSLRNDSYLLCTLYGVSRWNTVYRALLHL